VSGRIGLRAARIGREQLPAFVLNDMATGELVRKGDTMPQYRIIGADRETGENVSRLTTADSVEDAEAVAHSRGIMISRIVEVEPRAVGASTMPAVDPTNTNSKTKRETTTIEQTAKVWKLFQIIGAIPILAGGGLIFYGYLNFLGGDAFSQWKAVVGIGAIVIGVAVYSFARLMAWWYHG